MKFSFKRLAAFTLALVMVLGMLPVVNNSVNAAEITGLANTDIGLDGTEKYWDASDNTITGNVVGTKVSTLYKKATETLTITNNKSVTATLMFSYEISFAYTGSVTIGDDVTVTAGATDDYSVELGAGKSLQIVVIANQRMGGSNAVTVKLTNVDLVTDGTVSVTFAPPANGSYTVSYGSTMETVNAGAAAVTAENSSSEQYTLTAIPGSGNKFVGWYNETTGQYLSTKEELVTRIDKNCTIKAIIVPDTTAVFLVGSNYFSDLDEAVTYAQNNGLTQITLVSSGTISKSEKGIPAGMTLLIPRDTKYDTTPVDEKGVIAPEFSTATTTPKAFLTLTLGEGVSLQVNGTIDVEAMHTTMQGSARKYGGRVCGDYGAIYMMPNSAITVNDGGILYAWGFVYGDGAIAAMSGAQVYEYMQVLDMPGGSNLGHFADTDPTVDVDWDDRKDPITEEEIDNRDDIPNNDYVKIFPFQQYYVQNIELPLTLYAGAKEFIYTTITAGGQDVSTPPIEFIGESGNAMFVPLSGYIVKDYDPQTDRMTVTVNGDAEMNGIALDMSNHQFADTIVSVIGSTTFDSSLYILTLNGNITINIESGTTTIGQDMALMPGVEISIAKDATLVIANQEFEEDETNPLTVYGTGGHNIYVYDLDQWGKFIYQYQYLIPVTYSPSTGFKPRTVDDLKDVVIDINGRVICNGFIYSTVAMDDDFNPISGGACIKSSGKTGSVIMNNGAGIEDFAFRTDGDSWEDITAIDSIWLQNGDGTFLLTDGAEAGAEYYYCAEHDQWYTGDCEDCLNSTPSSVTITWIVEGEDNGTSDTPYNTVPVFPGSTPTKAQTGCTTYSFVGWSATEGGEVLSQLPAATAEATYYAIFTADSEPSHVGDANGDHLCDNESCKAELSSCKDDNQDHLCDYVGCQDKMSDCLDGNDKDHNCDYTGCGVENVDGGCHGGTAYCNAKPVCVECGQEYGSKNLNNHAGEGYYEPDGDDTHYFFYPCCGTAGGSVDCSDKTGDGDHLCDDCENPAITACSGGTAYCDAKAVCTECGEEYGSLNANNHSGTATYYGNKTDKTHTVYYACCDAVKATENHVYVNGECDCETKQKLTVSIYWNGSLWIEGNVYEYGTGVYFGSLANPTGYTFVGYAESEGGDVVVAPGGMYTVTKDVTLYAVFEKNTYTVTWVVNGKTTTETYEYGDVPSFKGSTDKAPNGCATYTFDGWDKIIVAVTGNVTYTAQYTEGTSHTSNEFNYESLGGTHIKTYKCCGAYVATEECSGGTAWCCIYAVCQYCENSYGSLDYSNHTGGGFYEAVGDTQHHFYHSCCATYDPIEDCSDRTGDGDHGCDKCVNNGITDCVTDAVYDCQDGNCVECGQEMPATVVHEADYACDKNCNICGDEIWPDRDHEAKYACDTQCQHCGQEIWPDAACESDADYACEDGNCIYCGEPVAATEDHDWADATCTEPKTCDCGAKDGNALGHGTIEGWEYINYEDYHEVWCKDCWDYSYNDDHDYGDDHECDCGAVEPHTVTFMNGDTVFKKVSYEHGSPLNISGMEIPDAPAAGYGWNGWRDAEGNELVYGMAVTSDLTFYATWKLNSYTVTWIVDGNTTTETYEYGAMPSFKGNTDKAADGCTTYTFDGWDNTVVAVTGSVTYTAQYTTGSSHIGKVNYTNLNNGYHKTSCDACGEVLNEAAEHVYDQGWAKATCSCGAAKEFKLTVVYGANGEYKFERMVPYWTSMADLDEFNNIPWTIYVNDASHLGHYALDDYYWDMDGDGDLDWDRYFIEGYMPARDMYVEARYKFNGWVNDGIGWQFMDYYNGIEKNTLITLTYADLYEGGSEEELEGIYMVDADGYRIENGLGRFYYLGECPLNGVTYAPNAEDIAYYENKGLTFIDKEMTWYYFGEDGKWQYNYTGLVGNSYVVNGQAAWHVGLVEIDGDYYYFKGDEVNGGNTMATGDVYVLRNNTEWNAVIGGIYTFDNEGKLCLFHGIVESELFEGKRYYVARQLMIGAGLIDLYTVSTGITEYFYVDSYGQLVVDAEYYIGANSFGIAKGVYYFDENGFLVIPEADPLKNGFYYEDGNWFYYVDGVKGYCAGLISTSGKLWYESAEAEGEEIQGWVYVKSDGSLVSGRTYYVTNVNDHASIESGDKCIFGADCLLQVAKNGIVDGYYYVNNQIAYNAGVVVIGGQYYYVRSNGQVVMDRAYWITNVGESGVIAKLYTFDENGVFVPEFEDGAKNGIVDGYYYVDGHIAYCAGLIEIEEGKYIYVKSNGQLATGSYWTTNHNGELAEGLYDFGEDGILVIE